MVACDNTIKRSFFVWKPLGLGSKVTMVKVAMCCTAMKKHIELVLAGSMLEKLSTFWTIHQAQ